MIGRGGGTEPRRHIQVTCLQRSRVSAFFSVLVFLAAVSLAGLSARGDGRVHANDMARFLAGLPPAPSSPLAAAARTPEWQRHAAELSAAWAAFEKRQVTRVRVWAQARFAQARPTMFYMFSGPDFVHADAFFPRASTYVLSGLEALGRRPEASAATGANAGAGLAKLRASLTHFMRYSYFVTRDMDAQFRAGTFTGTLPVLYVFLARTGKTIRRVEFVKLDAKGAAVPVKRSGGASGVRIIFAGADGPPRTLYYFRTNLTNAGVAKSRFLTFCARLGQGDSLVKSASYLMHTGAFTKVRDFLLRHSAALVQDDTGIPLKHFAPERWRLTPFGQYLGPTEEFKRFNQPDLASLFQAARARPVNFGIGYRWHPSRTNILVAERR